MSSDSGVQWLAASQSCLKNYALERSLRSPPNLTRCYDQPVCDGYPLLSHVPAQTRLAAPTVDRGCLLILTNVRTMAPTGQNHAVRWAVEPLNLNPGLVGSRRHFR
jgi:hypothetical protein